MHLGVSTYRLRVLVKKVNPKFCVCKTLSEKSCVFASTSVDLDASESKTLSAGVREKFREREGKRRKDDVFDASSSRFFLQARNTSSGGSDDEK